VRYAGVDCRMDAMYFEKEVDALKKEGKRKIASDLRMAKRNASTGAHITT
jgi:hypothetical protein